MVPTFEQIKFGRDTTVVLVLYPIGVGALVENLRVLVVSSTRGQFVDISF